MVNSLSFRMSYKPLLTNSRVKKLYGVGKVTAAKMENLGLTLCSDIKEMDVEELRRIFGKFGERLFELSKGIDNREVTTDRIRKSISVETTF